MNVKQLQKKFNLPKKEVSVPVDWLKGLLKYAHRTNLIVGKMQTREWSAIVKAEVPILMGYISSAKELIPSQGKRR